MRTLNNKLPVSGKPMPEYRAIATTSQTMYITSVKTKFLEELGEIKLKRHELPCLLGSLLGLCPWRWWIHSTSGKGEDATPDANPKHTTPQNADPTSCSDLYA